MRTMGLIAGTLVLSLLWISVAAGQSGDHRENLGTPGKLKPIDSELRVKSGQMAPDFTLPSVSGKEITLSQYRGKNVVISAPRDHANRNEGGALYVFEGATGRLLLTIVNPTPEAEDYFGVPVMAVGQNLLVGAPSDDESAKDAGAVYLFENARDSQ